MATGRSKHYDEYRDCEPWEHRDLQDYLDESQYGRRIVEPIPEMPPLALHFSAPVGLKCSDCTIDEETCQTCYEAWWKKRHPNTWLVERLKAAPKPADQEELWQGISNSFYPPPFALTIQACIDAVDARIVECRLQGNGCDKTAERNGLVLATNILTGLLLELPKSKVMVAEKGKCVAARELTYDDLLLPEIRELMKLTNLDIWKDHRDVEMWLMRGDFTGQFVRWVVEQSPYECPDLAGPLDEFNAYVSELMAGETCKQFTYDELNAAITEDKLMALPAVALLNVAKVTSGIGYINRHNTPHPDYDFIDISALARNIFYDMVREHILTVGEAVTK